MMIKKAIACFLILLPFAAVSQVLPPAFRHQWAVFQQDKQLSHAASSICILQANTGKVIFAENQDMGLAPASCNKTITAAAALHFLGEDFRYATALQYSGTIRDSTLYGNIIIKGSGDPTLGSWRYDETKADHILQEWTAAILKAGIRTIEGSIMGDDSAFGTQTLPDGWIWQDMGNYFGAGCSALNWIENQFDIYLTPSAHTGDTARVTRVAPLPPQVTLINELRTGAAGSGDQSYIYLPPYGTIAYLRGTVPADAAKDFSISGAVPDPGLFCASQLQQALQQSGIPVKGGYTTARIAQLQGRQLPDTAHTIAVHYSPSLDSIIYWFLKKSVNLYGELLVKKIAQQAGRPATTDEGMDIIHHFCADNGIDITAVNTIDGSGLSPANRITTYALAYMLYRDKQQSWFPAFFNALPLIHNIHMKDGYIGGVRSYTGYLTTRNGIPLIFSFIANNFSGSPSAIREKMWRVLDALK